VAVHHVRIKAQRLGSGDHLEAPVDPNDIATEVAKVLGQWSIAASKIKDAFSAYRR
jgi:hypothetical protein